MNKINKLIIFGVTIGIIVLCHLSTGCANRGVGPQGGPIDSIAPVIVHTSPANGATNVQGKEVVLNFDEYVQIEGAVDNILVSPPQQHVPEIKAIGKRVTALFQDSLQDNTTYTIDFGNQIVDLHEKNPYEDLTFAFSTGESIDSLAIYGHLIDAENLNPVSGIVVGLHAETSDSAINSYPFIRIGRTNAEGEFSIKNIKAGTYKLYALQDNSRDYVHQPGEGVAFYDEPITPYINSRIETDTLFLKDTLDSVGNRIPDSVFTAEYIYYEPSDLLLYLFKEDVQRHYFLRALRKEAHVFQLIFGAPQTQLPTLSALRLEEDSLGIDTTWVNFLEHSIVQTNATLDTITYWLTDSSAIQMDSIRFAMTYLKSDSVYNLVDQTDTILAVYRAPFMSERTKKAMQQKKEKAGLTLKLNCKQPMNFFDTLAIVSATPLGTYIKDKIHLQMLHDDTVWTEVPFAMPTINGCMMQLPIYYNWKSGSEYRLLLDSAAISDVYGVGNKKDKYSIRVRSIEEYSTIDILLQPYDPTIIIQLLNAQDQPVYEQAAQPGRTTFANIEPGVYYMRLILDVNGDGKWTTGSLAEKRQPEQVVYFPKKLSLRANWNFEETFGWQSIPLLDQKPEAIRKDSNAKKK